jgi:putative ABC transport system substrate-binding protein
VRRRSLVIVAPALALLVALPAAAQQAPTIRIGWLAPESKPFALDPFRQTLKELGWVEGGNLVIEQRYGRGVAEHYQELATDLVRLKVDVLVTDGTPATRAAQQAMATTPIVFVASNAVEQGFVMSLSHPGRNLTGLAIMAGDLNPKRIQLLKETVPGMARLAILEDQSATPFAPTSIHVGGNWQAIEAACRQLGIHLTPASEVRKANDLEGAFARAVRERAGGVLVLPSAFSPLRFSASCVRRQEVASRPSTSTETLSNPGGSCRMGPATATSFGALRPT